MKDIELPAKVLDYFLRSNKSNINQYIEKNQQSHQNRKLIAVPGV